MLAETFSAGKDDRTAASRTISPRPHSVVTFDLLVFPVYNRPQFIKFYGLKKKKSDMVRMQQGSLSSSPTTELQLAGHPLPSSLDSFE